MPRLKTRKARRVNRKQRGGFTESCSTLLRGEDVVTVTEDEIKVANPSQILCFGDAFTSCTAIIVVMEDNWKVGLHMNPVTFAYTNIRQNVNPSTAIPLLQTEINTNANLREKNIKKIYLISTSEFLQILPQRRRINNQNTIGRLGNVNPPGIRLTNATTRTFFSDLFPSKITAATQISIILNVEGQFAKTRKSALEQNPEINLSTLADTLDHFFIRQDGSLDLVERGRRRA